MIIWACVLIQDYMSPLSLQQVKSNLEVATSKTRTWKDKVAQHEGLIRLIQPGERIRSLENVMGEG